MNLKVTACSTGRRFPGGTWARFVGCFLILLSCTGCRKKKEPNFDQARERLHEYVLEEPPPRMRALNIEFQGKLWLLGYKVAPRGAVRPGRPLNVTLYWKADGPVHPGHRLFTHVLDGSGERILELDESGPLREPRDGRPALPPEAWLPGKVHVDELRFNVPRNVKTSRIQIVAGAMRDGQPLPVVLGEKDANGRALVATLRVASRRKKAPIAGVPSLRVDKLDPAIKIKIDGKLNEVAWQDAPVAQLVDVNTGKPNTTFPVNASIKLLWSDAGFYVGFDVKDPDVIGGFDKNAKDPPLWTRDAVEIMVDPDGDGDNLDYYEIQINPQNLVFDSRFDRYNEPKQEPDGPFGHQDWSSGLTSAVTVKGTIDRSSDVDEGYVVEALIPWSAFSKAKQSPPAIGDVWRLNFYAMQENSGVAWSPILNEGNFHKASRFGRVIWAEKSWRDPEAIHKAIGHAGPKPPVSETLRRVRPTTLGKRVSPEAFKEPRETSE